ncbi:MAG: UDP-N-acetylglucosamine 2-epimerase (non-hydrolyzing) [Prevotella sp.]|nr:UDP-N-acetylglucosamine 2-epimerase (non-hydrolyzing) [Prevotella sp.]MBR4602653.1 UDP-N-acetylglucosamine 2-epimerase (non-hydrolyzing) [Prevotella sp.]
MKKICIVAGARPNFIKVAPLIRAIDKTDDICYRLVYTGASDDPTLEGSLFSDLQIARPDVFLGVDCVSLNEITGRVMSAFEVYLQENPADVVIVVDDLASTMATAIVAKKQGVKLAHLVAGTRSFDIKMPKEINRLVIDGLSDLLFTAGMSNNSITNREGTEQSRVYMVGNILIDNLRFNHNRWQRPQVFDTMQLHEGEYIVFTLNRKALLADRLNLQSMLQSVVEKSGGVPVVAPLRGKAKEVVEQLLANIDGGSRVSIIEPLGYLEFGYLTLHARGIITDSGNVAEEATFNGVPCITLNSYTEHIETVKVGTNVLVGEDAEQLALAVETLVGGRWKQGSIPDRWDGRSAERIVSILLNA